MSGLIVAMTVATLSLTIAPASAQTSQTIAFAPVGDQVFGTPFSVSAVSSVVGQTSIHGSVSTADACDSVVQPAIQIFPETSSTVTVDLSSDATPQPHLGEAITLTQTKVTVTSVAAVLLQSYDFGIVTNGQSLSATLDVVMAATNTVEQTLSYATIPFNTTVAIHDPDGVPGTHDESVDPMILTASLPDSAWHPSSASQPVVFTGRSAVIKVMIPVGDTQWVWSQKCLAPPSPVLFTLAGSDPAPTGLEVSFSSDTPSVCTMAGWSLVTPVATGECTLRASQPGDASFSPAPDVMQSFQITRGTQIWMGMSGLDPAVYGSPPVKAIAFADLPVSFTSLSPSVCAASGTTTTGTVTNTMIKLLAGGTCTIRATQDGDSNWKPVPPAVESFIISYRVSSLAPPTKTKFVRGTTIPVRFRLTGANGQPIPSALAGGLGCTVTVRFNVGSPLCAVYEPATKAFAVNIATSRNLVAGRSYPIAVRAVVGSTTVASATTNVVAVAPVNVQRVPRSGYWMLGSDGRVYAFGDAPKLGNAPGTAVALAARADGSGYWVVDSVGNVSHFGTAADHGGHPALRSGESVSTLSATPSGNGYWLFTNRGSAFAYGDARLFGDLSRSSLNGPIIASVATPTGRGYYMVGSDGGVFTFGDAHFHGSTGGQHLNRPVVGISPTPDNRGYWLVASDGGVFAFGAPFRGSMGAATLNRPVNGLVAYGNGYLMVASDGGIFDFSDKHFAGSLADNPPSAPVIGVAAFSL